MKRTCPQIVRSCALRSLLLSTSLALPTLAPSQSDTAFSYQGHLENGGVSLDGTASLRFSLFDAAAAGNQIGSDVEFIDTSVDSGVIYQQLDFGNAFDGSPRWLEIEVDADGGSDNFVTLDGRVAILPVPYAQYAAQAGTVTSGAYFERAGANYVTTATSSDPVQNGLSLIEAYNTASNSTPNGSAIGCDNPVVVLVPPGVYDLGTSSLVMDTPYVSLVGISSYPYDQYIYGTDNDDDSYGVLVQTADHVAIENLRVHLFWNRSALNPVAYKPSSDLPSTVMRNCVISANDRDHAMEQGSAYSGTYDRVSALEIIGSSSQPAKYSFGRAGIASGTFIDCIAGEESFGAAAFATGLKASGTFIRCVAGDYSFGTGGGGCEVSGTFLDCTAGAVSFGGSESDGNLMSGTFVNCKAGNYSFGGTYSASGTGGSITGTFRDCTAGDASFGTGNGSGSATGARFFNCVATGNSFNITAGSPAPVYVGCLLDGAPFSGNAEFQTFQEVLTKGNDGGGLDMTNLGTVTTSGGELGSFGTSIDQAQESAESIVGILNPSGFGQSFVAGKSGNLVAIELRGGTFPTNGFDTFRVYEGEGFSGSVIAEITEPISWGPGETFQITLNPAPAITAGSRYTFLGESSVSELSCDYTNPYPSGQFWTPVAAVSGMDLYFKTYVDQKGIKFADGTIQTTAATYLDEDPTNELQELSSVLSKGNDAGGIGMTNLGAVSAASFSGDGSGLTGLSDSDPTNELQDLGSSASGTDRTISISNGASTTISVADNDNDPSNEFQALSFADGQLALSDANQVLVDSLYGADGQILKMETIAPVLDQYYSGNASIYNLDTDRWQSITAGTSGILTSVSFPFWAPSYPRTLRLSVYEGEGTSGALLGTQDFTLNSAADSEATFSTQINIVSGSVYTIHLHKLSGTTLYWQSGSGNPYPMGISSVNSDTDFGLSTYVAEVGLRFPDGSFQGTANTPKKQDLEETLLEGNDAGGSDISNAGTVTANTFEGDAFVGGSFVGDTFTGDGSGLTGINPIVSSFVGNHVYTVDAGASNTFTDMGPARTVSGLKAGDRVLLMASFRFRINNGSGTDAASFRFSGTSGACSTLVSEETGSHDTFNNPRGDAQLVSFHRLVTVTCNGSFTFRIQADTSLCDDEFEMTKIELTAQRF